MFVCGFTLALGKITTAAAALIAIVSLVGFNSIRTKDRVFTIRRFIKAEAVIAVPFALGVIVEIRLFLKSTETPLTIENRLLPTQMSDHATYLVNLIPVFAAVFAVAAMVLPVLLVFPQISKDALFFATAITSTFGLVLIFVLELPAGNEAWFLVAVLALALPLSSVVVVDSMSQALAMSRNFQTVKILTTLILLTLVPLLLLIFGANEFFIIRSWVVPGALVAISICFSLLWQFPTRMSGLHRLLALACAFLFISSLLYGFFLRTESAITSSTSRGEIFKLRDQWLEASQVAALGAQSDVGSSPIAIYSESPGELALTRWIPYFLATQVYTLGSLDELTDFFTPSEEIQSRQDRVSRYVNSQDLESCRELQIAGVRYIWITQGFDASSTEISTNSRPTLLPVVCASST
jgi:hypothetical protein